MPMYGTCAGLILLAWLLGGAIALLGAFIWAELAARRPAAGGQYAYLREAFHPLVAFLYGWTLLLVVQSGGMAYTTEPSGRKSTPASMASVRMR